MKTSRPKKSWSCDCSWESINSKPDDEAERAIINHTRLPKSAFLFIHRLVKPYLNHPGEKGFISPIPTKDQLLITLTFLARSLTYTSLGELFNLSTSAMAQLVKRVLNAIAPILEENFIRLIGEEKQRELKWTFERFPNVVAILDANEIEVARSGNNETQREFYSRKKKTQTVKFQTLNACNGLVMNISGPFEGTMDDMKAFRESKVARFWQARKPFFPRRSEIMCDKGYQGIENENGIHAMIPIKKPFDRELTDEQ